METSIKRALLEKITTAQLFSLKVFFTSAAASSPDYRIAADFGGALTRRMNAFCDLVQATCVEACNTDDWIIPFKDGTGHQAGSASENASQRKPTAPNLT